MTIYPSEVFAKLKSAKTRADKIKILQEHETPALKLILTEYFTVPFIKVVKPKYTPDEAPIGLNPSHMFKGSKQLYHFHADGASAQNKDRLNRILVQLLESMCKEEGDLLLAILQHRLKISGLTVALVLEAFPGLFVDPTPARKTKKPKPIKTPELVEK